jgi:hypothetical protein
MTAWVGNMRDSSGETDLFGFAYEHSARRPPVFGGLYRSLRTRSCRGHAGFPRPVREAPLALRVFGPFLCGSRCRFFILARFSPRPVAVTGRGRLHLGVPGGEHSGTYAAVVDRPPGRARRDAGSAEKAPGRAGARGPEDLRLAWEATALAAIDSPPPAARWAKQIIPEQYAILVTCRDEAQQVELLSRLHAEGLDCRALLS